MAGESLAAELTASQQANLLRRIERGLDQGAVAVGFGLAYTPVRRVRNSLKCSASRPATGPVATCTCALTTRPLANLEEVIDLARETGVQAHIVHINSSARDRVLDYLALIEKAQASGVDITTEAYPYNQGSTLIQSHLFNEWEDYTDAQLAQFIWSGLERPLPARRSRQDGAQRHDHHASLYSEESVRRAIASPLVMIASDGMWLSGGRAHPRSFGTFSRVLGRFVREQGALSLPEAIRKMTLMPAKRLERRIPGHAQQGAPAARGRCRHRDLRPRDSHRYRTYSDPARSPKGIRHVIVNGVLALDDREVVDDARPGRAVRAEIAHPFVPGTTWDRPGQ